MAVVSKRQKFMFKLDVKALNKEDKTNKITVEVWHNEGGHSILAGTTSARAITCSITPMEEQKNGIMILMLTHGLRYPLEEVKRRNDKKMEAWLAFVKDEIEKETGRAWDVLQNVLQSYKLELI